MKTSQSEDKQALPRSTPLQSVSLAIIYILCAWLIYNLYETVQRVIAYYVPVPVEDYWRVVQNLRDYHAIHLAVFWKQHNEHRIVFPEIVFAIDMLAAHGRMILTLACSFACYAAAWALLSFTVMGDGGIPFENRCYTVLVTGVFAFWQGSTLALAQPFLLEWPLMQLAVVLSLFFLKKAAETAKRRCLVAAIVSAVVATYSSANALFLWPLLLGIGLVIRLSKRFLSALGIAAVVSIGIYFIGYQPSGNAHVGNIFAHPGVFITFVTNYLSMPFGALGYASFGVFVGLVNLSLMGLLLGLAWRFRLFHTRPAVVLSGYFLFTLMTIGVTAVGRMDLADTNFAAARVVRYLTVPFLNWVTVILLCLWMSAQLRWRLFTTRRLTIVFSLLILWSTYKLRSWQQTNSDEYADHQVVALSLDAGLTDSEIIHRIFPSPDFVAAYLPELKQQRLAVFRRGHEGWLGKDVGQFGGVQSQKVPGNITYTYPVEHGLEVVGWVNSDDVRDPFPRIFLANERGMIVGFGRRPAAGLPLELRTLKTPKQEAWVAFVNLSVASRSIFAYAATRHGLAPIDGVATVPTFGAASRGEIGAPLNDIVWRMDKTWALNGIPVLPVFGWLPAAAVYSSWHRHDQNTGDIVGEFAAPANSCVVLPVLNGPSAEGASSQLVDVESGSVLADLPFQDRDALWHLWRVPLDPSVKRLRFLATDNGRSWGQWLAVSAPLTCK